MPISNPSGGGSAIPASALDTDPNPVVPSDARVMSQKAVVDYVDANAGGVVDGQQLNDAGALLALDAATRQLFGSDGATIVADWSAQQLLYDGTTPSIDWVTGDLKASDATLNLRWSHPDGLRNIRIKSTAPLVPSDIANIAGWIKFQVNGVDAYLPYYQ